MKLKFMVMILWLVGGYAFAGCPLDHLYIGCNPDGVVGNEDDNQLYIDCSEKYRNSPSGWANRYYPLGGVSFFGDYRLNQPGFNLISDDPSRVLSGDVDLVIECVGISEEIAVIAGNTIVMDDTNDSFEYSGGHVHLTWRVAVSGASKMQWVSLRVIDNSGNYEPSRVCSIAFGVEPMVGDVSLDGEINVADLVEMMSWWLEGSGGPDNDFCERADCNVDGRVDLEDFALLAEVWLTAG